MWQQNLIDNLIVIFILFALFIIGYCKIKNQTLLDVLKQIKQAFSNE